MESIWFLGCGLCSAHSPVGGITVSFIILCESAAECWDTQEAGFVKEVRFPLVLDKQGLTSPEQGKEYSTRREQYEQMHGGRKEYLEYWLCARRGKLAAGV